MLDVLPMRTDDIEKIMLIEQDIYAFPWTTGNFLDSLAAGYTGWIAYLEGVLIGYAVTMQSLDEIHVLNLSVARQRQGLGYGSQLLTHLLTQAQQCAAKRILLEVRFSNMAAQNLYKKMGFTQIGVRPRYYPATQQTREDALVLQRLI